MAKRKRATLISWIMYYTMSQMEVCWAYDMCFLILESMAPSCFHLPSSPSSWSFTLDDVRENPADIVGFCCSFLPLIFCVVFLTVYGFPPWSSVVLRGCPWLSMVLVRLHWNTGNWFLPKCSGERGESHRTKKKTNKPPH